MWRFLALCAAMVSMAMAKNVHWEAYKAKHGLSFEDHEEVGKMKTFQANREFINEHNFYADLGEHTYWLGVNKFAHMTNKEFRAKVIGNCLLDRNSTAPPKSFCTPAPEANAVHKHDPALADNPASVDWRTKGYVTPIKNQEHCGSCWAFSTVGSLEGAHFKKTGKLVSLSEQNLVDCSKAEGNMGCHGGLMDKGFTYIHTNGGIDTEASYPYKGVEGTCKFNKDNVGATVSACYDIKHQDEGALETAVATIGPISVAIDAHLRSFQLYKEGIYHDKMCSSVRLDHGVLAVGYSNAVAEQGANLSNGHNYWIVKNSWGEEWGDKGYIHMAKDKKNACGIATMATYPVE